MIAATILAKKRTRPGAGTHPTIDVRRPAEFFGLVLSHGNSNEAVRDSGNVEEPDNLTAIIDGSWPGVLCTGINDERELASCVQNPVTAAVDAGTTPYCISAFVNAKETSDGRARVIDRCEL